MALQNISQLFSDRNIRIDSSDIQHGIEQFLQDELHSERVHCRTQGDPLRVDVRVGSPALAEAVLLREREIREYAKSVLQCSVGTIRVMLDI